MSKESFKEWLESQESYYVTASEYREAQEKHGVEVTLPVGITVWYGDEGETKNVPTRDIRHGKWEEDNG